MIKDKALFKSGLKDGIPIGLGYLPAAFSIAAALTNASFHIIHTIVMGSSSYTCVGMQTTLNLVLTNSTLWGIFLSLLIVNIRNTVLAIALNHRLEPNVSTFKKFFIAFGNTDEIFALTITKEGQIKADYFLGVAVFPFFMQVIGVALGATVTSLLPEVLRNAMSIAVYAMLISCVVPATKKSKPILYTVLLSGVLSWVLKAVGSAFVNDPSALGKLMTGLFSGSGVLIIGSLISVLIIAKMFPIKDVVEEEPVNE